MSGWTIFGLCMTAVEGLLALFCVCASVYGAYPMDARLVMLGVALVALWMAIDLAYLTKLHRDLDL